MKSLSGKGLFTWKLKNCEGGHVDQIIEEGLRAGLTHILVKIADGVTLYNQTVPLLDIINALKLAGFQVWGWQYTYGGVWIDSDHNPHYGDHTPEDEARVGAARALELGVDGFVVDAEQEYKVLNQRERARRLIF